MLAWLSANLINIALVLAVALLVFVLVRSLIRDKRAGKSPCGGNCSGCGGCASCAMGSSCRGEQ